MFATKARTEPGIEVLRPRRKVTPAAAATAGLLLLVGCSSGGIGYGAPGSGTRAPSPTAGVDVPSPPTADPTKTVSRPPFTHGMSGMPCAFSGDYGPVKERLGSDESIRLSPGSLVTAVRLGRSMCSQRVVIRIDGVGDNKESWPGVVGGYVEPPIKNDPSDLPAHVDGNAFYQVTVGSWSANKVNGAVNGLKEGPIEDVVETGNSEGISTYTLGLDQRRPVSYSEVSGTAACPGACLVLDFANGVATRS